MQHALIIDENMVVSRYLEERLSDYGFTSFSHAWTEDQAMLAARRRRPDLVIVGDSIEEGSGVNAARRISERYGVPALLVTTNSDEAKKALPPGAELGGPFLLDEVRVAVASSTLN